RAAGAHPPTKHPPSMTLPHLLLMFVSAALFITGVTAVSNFLLFPRLRPAPAPAQPFVSILIPARNEAAVIGRTLRGLLAQTAVHFELLLLDDASTDGTSEVARAAAAGDPRVRILHGAPLPPGWLGKNWACQQLGAAARGDLLVFADADVQWQPDALAALLAAQTRTNADLLTVWPTQTTVTWAERLVVPAMALAILAYLPILPVHHAPWPAFAAANGQCLAFRRAAYTAVGGHAAVRAHIVEDVALARRVKQAGLRLRMADGSRLIGCRMYTGWPQVRDGFAKNILAGHANSVPFLLASTLFHWLVFVFPWLWLLLTGSLWALALALLGVGLRLATAVFTHQRPLDALLMPVTVLLMTRIAAQAVAWHYGGGPRWKGRVIEIED
ncbi:MAG: glycosyltransferase, partial [Anaerolineales bacterium]|nr:glycosyltransferase [Anaerolineales bacterium]